MPKIEQVEKGLVGTEPKHHQRLRERYPQQQNSESIQIDPERSAIRNFVFGHNDVVCVHAELTLPLEPIERV